MRGPLTRRREASWDALEDMPDGMTPSERVRWLHARKERHARRLREIEKAGMETLSRYPGADAYERFRAFMRDLRGDDR